MLENLITHSDPQIVHAPGFDKAKPELWWKILSKIHKIKPSKSFNDLSVITWNNQEQSCCEKSLAMKNIKYNVLGRNIDNWNNLLKFFLISDFCKHSKEKYCIGLDAFDVVFFGEPYICVDRFLKMNKKLVFNSEKNFYPNCQSKYFQECKNHQSEKNNSLFRFLNSGAWIGYTEYCQSFFEEASKIKLWESSDCDEHKLIKNCDQSVIHGLYKKYDLDVDVDFNCRIFQNLSHVKDEVRLSVLY